jgi:hypothetical protein
MTSVPTLPSAELSIVTELTSLFGDGHRFTTILPQDITTRITDHIIVSRVKRISGGPNQQSFFLDRPVIDIDTFYSDYATADLAARDIQAALFNMRGRRLMFGVVQIVRAIISPRWLPDPDPKLFRFGATYQMNFHAGGRTI